MATQIRFRRGTTAQNMAFTGALAEVSVDTDLKSLRVHDGGTPGGSLLSTEATKNDNSLGYATATKTNDYAVVAADDGVILVANKATAITFSLAPAATLGAKFAFIAQNIGAGTLTIDPNGAELIDGAATITIATGSAVVIFCDGTQFRSLFNPSTKLDRAGGVMTPGGIGVDFSYQPISNPSGALMQGFLQGLVLSDNAGDTTNSIDIAAGAAAAASSPYALMPLASALGKNLSASWVAGGTPGAPVGGLDTGAVADGTYHVYLMQRSDTGVVDACFSLSASAPTTGGAIPAAYNRFRRIGSVIRVGGTILQFSQNGDEFLLKSAKAILNAAAIPDALGHLLQLASVPTGVKVVAKLRGQFTNASTVAASILLITSPDETDRAANLTSGDYNVQVPVAGVPAPFVVDVRTDTSAQIRYRAGNSSSAWSLTGYGWVDTRGRI